MKYIGVLFIFICCLENVLAQKEELIPIINHQVISLDSRGSTFFSGKSTEVIELDLPINTIRWYYRVYNVNQKELVQKYAPNISFIDQISDKLNKVGINITTPTIPTALKNKLSVYLLKDSSHINLFKTQFSDLKLSYLEEFSIIQQSAGWKEVCDPQYISGKQYIALANHGNLTSTHVVVDIVAICKRRTIDLDWDEKILIDVEKDIVNTIAHQVSPTTIEKTSNCILQSLQFQLDKDQYLGIEQKRKEELLGDLLRKCTYEHSNTKTDTLKGLSSYFLIGNWISERGEELKFIYPNEIILKKKSGETLRGIWYVSDESLTINFDQYKTQKYQPILISPDKFIWKNVITGNFLRYQRLIKP